MKISGQATVNTHTNKIDLVHIDSIMPLEPLAFGADFWTGYSFDDLVRLQGVEPLEDVSTLAGGWAEDEDPDEMLAEIYRERG